MPRHPSTQPTEVELQILRILWEHGPSTAREIHNELAGERETNYSTTVKMLSVMLDKKLVKRDETGAAAGVSAGRDAGPDAGADAQGFDHEGLRRVGGEPGAAGALLAEIVTR